MSQTRSMKNNSSTAALEAVARGYVPIPIRDGGKNPAAGQWTHTIWSSAEAAAEEFDRWRAEGAGGIGLLLGEPSDGLVDIDLDHPKALRLRDYFLPPTKMRSGRPGRPISHHWYRVVEDLPGTRRYKMPDGSVSVELRSTGAQTVIPPSTHPSGEPYRWEGPRWGGKAGPAEVSGKTLAVQVALLGLGCVLIENWPRQGGRHDAYLALAGGLLRFGNEGVHPYWEKNLPVLIGAMASATHDEDGPEVRVKEVMGSTMSKLRAGTPAVGFPRLAEIIGTDHAEMVRRQAREVEALAGFVGTAPLPAVNDSSDAAEQVQEAEALASTLPPEERDPLGERVGTWQPVDLDPYLAGEVTTPQPTILRRSDGQGLFYEGRVNSLYGQSEAAKSWVALIACQQEMSLGERVMYLDLEDEPLFTLARLKAIGVGDDDVRAQFTYLRPEDPIAPMQKNRFGGDQVSDVGKLNLELFLAALDRNDPSLIIVDGMTVLYGLHGHDSNDAVGTDIITSWLKSLCRNGRSTVIVIDHTGKSAQRGSAPIGAHHKIAMVQGTALQVHPVEQPMPGALGEVHLLVFKDRPGEVRAHSSKEKPAMAASVILDSRVPGVTTVSVNPPDPNVVVLASDQSALDTAAEKFSKMEAARERERQAEALDEAIMMSFDGDLDKEQSREEIEHATDHTDLREEIRALVRAGRLAKRSDNRWARYRLAN